MPDKQETEIDFDQSPDEFARKMTQTYKQGASVTPPRLPAAWKSAYVLNVFGDLKTPLGERRYKQLMIANVSYWANYAGTGVAVMMVDLFLMEDLTMVTFWFETYSSGNTYWYWLQRSSPSGRIIGSSGPYACGAAVPGVDVLTAKKARSGQFWRTGLGDATHFILPTNRTPDPEYGTWFDYRDTPGSVAVPSRIINIVADNGIRLPILGAIFTALGTGKYSTPADAPDGVDKYVSPGAEPASAQAGNPLLTQRDLMAALAAPVFSCNCTLADIQQVVPGLAPNDGHALPEWTDTVMIKGSTIGQAYSPFPTLVYYDDKYPNPGTPGKNGRQLSQFFYYSEKSTYDPNSMQKEYLKYATTDVFEYSWIGIGFGNPRKIPAPPVGYPRRNFPKLMGSTIQGRLTNPDFGIPAGRSLYFVVSGEMDRPMKSPTPVTASIFWWWFFEDDTGVFFSECDFHTPQFHDLSVIDYAGFKRNAVLPGGILEEPDVTAEENVPEAKPKF